MAIMLRLTTVRTPLLLLLLVSVCAPACTALPAAEYGAFKESAEASRKVGEDLLLDYSTDLKRAEDADIRIPEGMEGHRTTAEAATPGDPLELDITAAFKVAEGEDPIAVRLKAWDIFGQYVAAMNGLVKGESVNQVAPAVDGLMRGLEEFPIESVVEAAADIAPFAGAITAFLELAEKAYTRELFIEIVNDATPAIDFLVEQLLVPDAQNFYNVRLGLYALEYDPMMDRISDLGWQFVEVVNAAYPATPTETGDEDNSPPEAVLDDLTNKVNEILMRIPGTTDDMLLSINGTAADTSGVDVAYTKLNAAKAEIEALVTDAVDRHAAMLEYRTTIIAYVRSLRHLQTNSHNVVAALKSNETASLDVDVLVGVVIEARKSYAAYKDRK